MESIKRKWGKPGLDVQVFVPNEFIAACAPDDVYVTYEFWCNAGTEVNKVYEYPRSYQGLFHPCKAYHTVTVRKGETIDHIFPRGYILYGTNVKYNELGQVVSYDLTGERAEVRIWYGDDNDDLHCTTALDESEYTKKNPS